MRLFAPVKNNGVVVQGVSVKFVITHPNGKTTQVTSTSGSDGYARASHKASKFRGTAYGPRHLEPERLDILRIDHFHRAVKLH